MKTFFVIMLIGLLGVLLYKYKDGILDCIAVAMGKMKSTSYSHQNYSNMYSNIPTEADNAALVSNEQTFEPNEPAELRINV